MRKANDYPVRFQPPPGHPAWAFMPGVALAPFAALPCCLVAFFPCLPCCLVAWLPRCLRRNPPPLPPNANSSPTTHKKGAKQSQLKVPLYAPAQETKRIAFKRKISKRSHRSAALYAHRRFSGALPQARAAMLVPFVASWLRGSVASCLRGALPQLFVFVQWHPARDQLAARGKSRDTGVLGRQRVAVHSR
jgi:hypothetical protein